MPSDDHGYRALASSHLDVMIGSGTDVYGPDHNAMWMASLDVRTGRYPKDDSRPALDTGQVYRQITAPRGSPLYTGKRVYRNIDAPRGTSLYWDQPLVVAAYRLGDLTGEGRFASAARAYTSAFLERCVAPTTGVFLWGNHYYYDAFQDVIVSFHGEEDPQTVDLATETGWLHEARPIPPAWDTFWRVDPEATERCIRSLSRMHVVDPAAGSFNRHADGKFSHAFLEAGGILAESLGWLYRKTADESLADLALRVARFSWEQRNPDVGLPPVSPLHERWDMYACTTELGLWAGSLLRAGDHTGRDEFAAIAQEAIAAYLRYGYDEAAGRYYGRLRVADGQPELGNRTTPYQPDDYSDPWLALFPAHDYASAFAETCLALYRRTGRAEFEEGVRRWAGTLARCTPANDGRGAYAEHYGRAIHFLAGASTALGDDSLRAQAQALAEEAIGHLYAGCMFRGHPGEDRYDAVDGVGYLLLALLRLETGSDLDLMGFGF